jgi:hypothetical protein
MQERFVPLAIHNNKGGEDKRVLDSYKEPSWNNPVVRFFASDGQELIERKDRAWSAVEHVNRMVLALEKAGKKVPGYLRIAQEELSPAKLERASFSMACYWKGEAFFGGMEGVRSTSAGWLEGNEVVEVLYDPKLIDLSKLITEASSNSCANRVWVADQSQLPAARRVAGDRVKVEAGAPRDAKTSDRKFHLQRSAAKYLDLTPLQATRANSILERRGDLREVISSTQWQLFKDLRKALELNPDALKGIERPTELAKLPAYRSLLRKRLSLD